MSGPTQRLDAQRGAQAVQELLRAASQIESILSRGPASAPELIARN